jgi:hypothetical protein
VTAGIKACSDQLAQLGWHPAFKPRASGWQVIATRRNESFMVIGPDLKTALECVLTDVRRHDGPDADDSASPALTPAGFRTLPATTFQPTSPATKEEVSDPEILKLLARVRHASAETVRLKAQADKELARSQIVLDTYRKSRAKRKPPETSK